MAKYFKFIGVVELMGFIAGEIILLVCFFQSLRTPSWWIFGLSLIASTIFGPAVGLLFYSYGNHLEEVQYTSPKPVSNSYSNNSNSPNIISFSTVYFGDKSIERIKKISAVESSSKYTEEEISKMSDEEIKDLYEKGFSNRAKPIVKELSEVSFQNDMIKISGTAFNLKLMNISNYALKARYISFKIYATQYIILYSNPSEANKFYELINYKFKSYTHLNVLIIILIFIYKIPF